MKFYWSKEECGDNVVVCSSYDLFETILWECKKEFNPKGRPMSEYAYAQLAHRIIKIAEHSWPETPFKHLMPDNLKKAFWRHKNGEHEPTSKSVEEKP